MALAWVLRDDARDDRADRRQQRRPARPESGLPRSSFVWPRRTDDDRLDPEGSMNATTASGWRRRRARAPPLSTLQNRSSIEELSHGNFGFLEHPRETRFRVPKITFFVTHRWQLVLQNKAISATPVFQKCSNSRLMGKVPKITPAAVPGSVTKDRYPDSCHQRMVPNERRAQASTDRRQDWIWDAGLFRLPKTVKALGTSW